jgi:hypothetical protein
MKYKLIELVLTWKPFLLATLIYKDKTNEGRLLGVGAHVFAGPQTTEVHE